MACRSVATALLAVVASVSTIGLQGCGGGGKEPTTYFFQNLGTGACRNADDGKGEYTCEGNKLTEKECGDLCLGGPTCVGFETNMDRTDPDVPANINCTCELHTKAVTKVEPVGHDNAKCFSKVSLKDLGTGACRIADGVGKGDYTCHPTNVTMVECRDLCLAGPSCVGFETNLDRKDPDVPANKDCTCELHTTAVTKVEPKDHPKAECYSVEKMITETATYV